MRAYSSKRGGHVHLSFFEHGKMGDLVCSSGPEFEALKRAMPGVCFKEDEKRLAPEDEDDARQASADMFARWLELGPKLASAAGCYVGIKVTELEPHE